MGADTRFGESTQEGAWLRWNQKLLLWIKLGGKSIACLTAFAPSALWGEANLLAWYQAPGVQEPLSGVSWVAGFSEPWTHFLGPDFGGEGSFLS